ncbi:hypothetical protein E1218_08780 [Kribbella turkmenica]|uniref:ESX-1 secretion-associated protein n=1 Tax=Kribbella turkmenica TaxID=2530375 RepID=A0A4V2YGR1_9ACTN|nr:DUF6507 family protein [Kribbella turkmenica]TDD28017.1 hypothetical protein E1218_08780 [Kribbella turkmenica]
MDWDIDVEGVNKVLTDTVNEAKPFDGLAKTYGTNLGAIVEGLNYDVFTVVAVAIGEYAQHWSPTLEAAAKQVGASLTGAQNAVKAYMEGQSEMALNAQRAAAKGEIPNPPGGTRPTGGNKAV